MVAKKQVAQRDGWLHEAVTDENGVVDAAYVAVMWALAAVCGTVIFLCAMSAISYFNCYVIADVGGGTRAQVPCSFDPQPVGVAIGAVLAAFAGMIGALAGYMAATRRREKPGAK
jgi:hypothetical protein